MSDVETQSQELQSQESEKQAANDNEKLFRLPLSRIKSIMKSDPDVTLASQEAVITLAKATELFIHSLSKDAVISTLNSKRKTLQRKDLDSMLDTKDCYVFLEGTLDS
ncbi:hypothetical protein FSP39_001498 [Pinctada imbricata]|uniref:Transcription factor CBF/NF-Y/archaeal histone domain-containing protein n=1 Tax=Pinctada imbricata TaxID=66713 RepID=A0AA89C2R2_PINIB|nr:hypothetical protein FSP39_001498 [Pinctada imbricata]